MQELKTTEAQRRSNKKWDDNNAGQIGIKAKKKDIDECKEYAKGIGITPSKFAMLAMKYCIENNIRFESENK